MFGALTAFTDGLAIVLGAFGPDAVALQPQSRPPAKRGTPSAGTPPKRVGRALKVHLVKGLRP